MERLAASSATGTSKFLWLLPRHGSQQECECIVVGDAKPSKHLVGWVGLLEAVEAHDSVAVVQSFELLSDLLTGGEKVRCGVSGKVDREGIEGSGLVNDVSEFSR